MPTYSAADIVGRTLVAKIETPVFNRPSYDPAAQIITTARAGNVLGVVDSWVGGTAGKPLNWQFKTPAGQFYYIAHDARKFDTNSLQEQGALTTQEKAEQEANANMSTGERIVKSLTKIAMFTAGGLILVKALNVTLQNRRK